MLNATTSLWCEYDTHHLLVTEGFAVRNTFFRARKKHI